MEGRKDRGTAVPRPVPAGTDTHHSMRGPVTLQHFSLQMLGSRRRCQALPALPFAQVFARTMASAHCKGGPVCFGVFLWGFFF